MFTSDDVNGSVVAKDLIVVESGSVGLRSLLPLRSESPITAGFVTLSMLTLFSPVSIWMMLVMLGRTFIAS